MEENSIGKFIGYNPSAGYYYQRKEYLVSMREIKNEVLYYADGYYLERGSWDKGGITYNARLVGNGNTYFVVPEFNNTNQTK